MDYTKIKSIVYETDSTKISIPQWKKLMLNSTQADRGQVSKLIKLHCPEWYAALELKYYSQYKFHKTKTHLIVVYSSNAYFFRYN